jgi:hypothetical protein
MVRSVLICCFDKPNRILALAQSPTVRTCKRRNGETKQARSESMQKETERSEAQEEDTLGLGFQVQWTRADSFHPQLEDSFVAN